MQSQYQLVPTHDDSAPSEAMTALDVYLSTVNATSLTEEEILTRRERRKEWAFRGGAILTQLTSFGEIAEFYLGLVELSQNRISYLKRSRPLDGALTAFFTTSTLSMNYEWNLNGLKEIKAIWHGQADPTEWPRLSPVKSVIATTTSTVISLGALVVDFGLFGYTYRALGAGKTTYSLLGGVTALCNIPTEHLESWRSVRQFLDCPSKCIRRESEEASAPLSDSQKLKWGLLRMITKPMQLATAIGNMLESYCVLTSLFEVVNPEIQRIFLVLAAMRGYLIYNFDGQNWSNGIDQFIENFRCPSFKLALVLLIQMNIASFMAHVDESFTLTTLADKDAKFPYPFPEYVPELFNLTISITAGSVYGMLYMIYTHSVATCIADQLICLPSKLSSMAARLFCASNESTRAKEPPVEEKHDEPEQPEEDPHVITGYVVEEPQPERCSLKSCLSYLFFGCRRKPKDGYIAVATEVPSPSV